MVATGWNGRPADVDETLDYVTCRDGRKMDPNWSNDNVSLTCNANLVGYRMPMVRWNNSLQYDIPEIDTLDDLPLTRLPLP